MKRQIIEIKAKCNDHKRVRDFLLSQHADFTGKDHQIDTYFRVNNGRLKLREGTIENHLICYERENREGPKLSKVILFASDPNSSLKEILAHSVGILVIVDKMREIYFIDNVKSHIDTVKGLGTFLEIEAIDTDGRISKQTLLEQCNRYLSLLRVTDADLIPVSYSDLLLRKNTDKDAEPSA